MKRVKFKVCPLKVNLTFEQNVSVSFFGFLIIQINGQVTRNISVPHTVKIPVFITVNIKLD